MKLTPNYINALNAMEDGIVIVDHTGTIVFFNDSYSRFVNCPLSEAIGLPLLQLRPGALMPETILQGKSLICTLRSENGIYYFASIYPIFENGVLTGGISIVTFLENAQYFAETLASLKEKESLLQQKMLSTNGTRYNFSHIIYQSQRMADLIEVAKKIASTDGSVLLQGESGCGKEVFAQSIHNESPRQAFPFIAINCAALNKDILESELFGYVAGAFTGAKREGKVGLFEAAENGTIFLDEISELDLELQAKLLRTLQEKKIRRLGSTKEIPINVRIISACNVDLQRYIEEKRFRLDLYYRLAVVPLQILPLRERPEDILPLAKEHLKEVSIQYKKKFSIQEDVTSILNTYHWPGNIRELYNVLEYAALMCKGSVLQPEDLPATLFRLKNPPYSSKTLLERVHEFERSEIRRTLSHYEDSVDGKKLAAKELGISLASLYNKLKS